MIKLFTLASLLCVYSLNDAVVVKLELPLTSGMFTLNCVVLPFVNVKFLVPLSNDAVVKDKLVEVNKLAVAVFILLIEVFTLALFVSKLLTLWLFD